MPDSNTTRNWQRPLGYAIPSGARNNGEPKKRGPPVKWDVQLKFGDRLIGGWEITGRIFRISRMLELITRIFRISRILTSLKISRILRVLRIFRTVGVLGISRTLILPRDFRVSRPSDFPEFSERLEFPEFL